MGRHYGFAVDFDSPIPYVDIVTTLWDVHWEPFLNGIACYGSGDERVNGHFSKSSLLNEINRFDSAGRDTVILLYWNSSDQFGGDFIFKPNGKLLIALHYPVMIEGTEIVDVSWYLIKLVPPLAARHYVLKLEYSEFG